jgi:Flp pilus assembly protein TadG
MATRSTFVRHRRFKRFRSESGVSLIHVALLLFVMMGLSMFVTDYGILWLARGQAQNAADAGALAGATSLAFDDANNFLTTGPAYNAATKAATTNMVFGAAPTTVEVFVDPATYGSWVPSPVPAICTSVGGCAQVNVYRTGMPTYFANVFGINSQQIRATATAQARGANAVKCLKPFGILDKWAEHRLNTPPGVASDGVWHSGENGDTPISTYDRYYSPTGSTLDFLTAPPTLDSYTRPVYGPPPDPGTSFQATPMPGGDLGRQLALTVGKQNDRPPAGATGNIDNPFTAGWFIPVTPSGGNTVDYKAAITGCISQTISLGQTLDLLNVPGNRVQKTAQAVGCGPPDMSGCDAGMYAQDANSLYNQDPGAHWVNGRVVGSCCALSPRIVPAAIVDPDEYIQAQNNGSSTVTLINMIGVFVDGFRVSDEKVVVHMMRLPAEFNAGGGAVPAANSFLEYISLVR